MFGFSLISRAVLVESEKQNQKNLFRYLKKKKSFNKFKSTIQYLWTQTNELKHNYESEVK